MQQSHNPGRGWQLGYRKTTVPRQKPTFQRAISLQTEKESCDREVMRMSISSSYADGSVFNLDTDICRKSTKVLLSFNFFFVAVHGTADFRAR
jgi:hypothetical protein